MISSAPGVTFLPPHFKADTPDYFGRVCCHCSKVIKSRRREFLYLIFSCHAIVFRTFAYLVSFFCMQCAAIFICMGVA